MNTATIQTHLSPKLKKDTQKTFKSMGTNLSSGIRLYLTHVVRTQSIPSEMFTFDNLSEQKKVEIIKDAEYALKHNKRYNSIAEAHADILSE